MYVLIDFASPPGKSITKYFKSTLIVACFGSVRLFEKRPKESTVFIANITLAIQTLQAKQSYNYFQIRGFVLDPVFLQMHTTPYSL